MNQNIFIIDDDSTNLFLAEILIKENGFFDTITSYETALDALNYLSSNQKNFDHLPDIILLDLNMPNMDGWQFLNQFEILFPLLNKNIDIFILSSSENNGDIQRSKQHPSVKGFCSKPLTGEMLFTMTSNLASAS